MNRAIIDATDARRRHNAARDATDREVLTREADIHTANAVAKIQRDKQNRDKRFRQWDSDLSSDEFLAYLNDRGIRIENAWQPLPAADEAEFAALGAMLQTPFALKHGLAELRIPHMRRPRHRHILRAISMMRQKQAQGERVSVDVITVAEQLKRAKVLEESGGFDYLSSCTRECPNSHNIRAYCRAIIEASRQRYLFLLGQSLQAEALQGFDSGQLLNAVTNATESIQRLGYADLKTIFETTK